MNQNGRAIGIHRNDAVVCLVVLEVKTVASVGPRVHLTQRLFLEQFEGFLQFVLLVIFNEFDGQQRTLDDLVLLPQLREVLLDQLDCLVDFALLDQGLDALSEVYTLLLEALGDAFLRLGRALLDFRFFNFSSLLVGKGFRLFVVALWLHVAISLNDLLV